MFNLDETGCAFAKLAVRCAEKGIGGIGQDLVFKLAKTKGNLSNITLLPVICADGTSLSPTVVFPGKQAHWRRLADGTRQTVHAFLPPGARVHQRDPAGVDTAIFRSFADMFLEETADLRSHGRHIMLVYDGYSAHIQFDTLYRLQQNRVVVVALPSHTSHRLQPLDVEVFGPFKSKLSSLVRTASMHTKKINVFAAAACITEAYGHAFTSHNIMNAFEKTGVWHRDTNGPNPQPLLSLFSNRRGTMPNVQEFMQSFQKSSRSLVFSANVEDEGTVKIDTSAGAVLTSDVVLAALKKREQRRKRAIETTEETPIKKRALAREYAEEDMQEARLKREVELSRSRGSRRAIRRLKAARAAEGHPFVSQGGARAE